MATRGTGGPADGDADPPSAGEPAGSRPGAGPATPSGDADPPAAGPRPATGPRPGAGSATPPGDADPSTAGRRPAGAGSATLSGDADPPVAGQAAESPRKRDAAATRRALLRAAHDRFTRLGYDRTTLRDVAADVGVNLALIKRYFDSKEGLFKAALASTPRFPGGGEEFPRDSAALAEALSRQLSADAWPEFGEHPVLMLLRVSGDERVDGLRRQALQDFSRQVLEASGAQGERNDEENLLRAQLVVALGVGVAVVRSAVGLQPLRDATSDDLVGPLRDVVNSLLAAPPD
ncbi:TetR family transcriptional regulator [Streptosporangium sp. NPDC002524]|uniref:TetR/AcrR family transcriptional regulator n=1 Tax=Streptosporangium sp. NPDC002524 TaxID=3154537 RepID=UPI00332331E1